MIDLKGKRVLVTGGSAGLGAEIVRQLAKAGCSIVINYANNNQRAEELLKEVEGLSTTRGDSEIKLVKGSAFDRDEIKRIVADSISALGGIDAVVSNAGWTKFAPFTDIFALADEDWMKTYQANVLSHLWLMQDVKEELKKNKGSFIITASVAGRIPSGSSIAYSVSKAGGIHLARGLAKACAPEIRVNSVSPGLLLTEWTERYSAEQIKGMEDRAALKKVTGLDDCAAVFLDLIRNESTTGQDILVDAGLTIP